MKTKLKIKLNQGFSLLEAVVGMLIFTIAISALLPLFWGGKVATMTNDARIGGIAVSQRIMDQLRAIDVTTLPSSGSNLTTLPTGESLESLPYKGKTYSATISYCQTASNCNSETRQINVKVYTYGNTSTPLYQLETVYARLQ